SGSDCLKFCFSTVCWCYWVLYSNPRLATVFPKGGSSTPSPSRSFLLVPIPALYGVISDLGGGIGRAGQTSLRQNESRPSGTLRLSPLAIRRMTACGIVFERSLSIAKTN